MRQVTTTDRRGALRFGAGLTAAALTTGCSTAARDPVVAGHSASPARPARAAPAAPGPRRFPGQPAQIDHGPRNRPRVALTFHGQGDPAIAYALLKEAERAHARVTVLAVGTWLDEHPAVARRILDGGHDLGNHTLNHRDINTMSEARARAEITGCADRIRRLTGSIGTWFRPSRTQQATPLVVSLAAAAGYPHVLSYDVDSLDFTSPGAAEVTRKVTSQIREGSVVSLHFGYADTVAALPALLEDLDRRGLAAVTTTELLT
ncbi:polysaccharide deacetylase family protein [Streptomyces sp. NBC_00056]|uniref:polysaccharide deacetylase family protein n=1 Tax=unclassified Streptomyces TaxID=2593676 RepID=UPI00224D83C3|nr:MULTISPECIES: polysaccharide deacetylase family protein [unclassified Streptomyces]MCX5439740.1 polysaccharide deacetylase family protein [Streptomyces sp. NBC_00063]WUB93819.1 polysaccharide deacetylase family protein [Streptomyces sp. NBC_00569]